MAHHHPSNICQKADSARGSLLSCPVDILLAICALLTPEDVASFRLITKHMAAIGVHYLVNSVQFHTCPASIKRLNDMSTHTIFSRSTRTLHWEATRLQPGMILPELERWIIMMNKKPTPPRNLSEREYRRNLAKWKREPGPAKWAREIESQFRKYEELVASQEKAETTVRRTLTTTICHFANLKEVYFNNEPDICLQRSSQRFRAQFDNIDKIVFPALFDSDTQSTLWQIRKLLTGIAKSESKLEKLVVHSLEPSFFDFQSEQDLEYIYKAVKTLKHINIRFRSDKSNRSRRGYYFSMLSRGGFRDMLAASPLLECLEVSFDHLPEGDYIALTDVLGDVAWPRLKRLLISNFSATEDEFMACLGRQNSLEDVSIRSITLTKGSWRNAMKRIQMNLALQSLNLDGVSFKHILSGRSILTGYSTPSQPIAPSAGHPNSPIRAGVYPLYIKLATGPAAKLRSGEGRSVKNQLMAIDRLRSRLHVDPAIAEIQHHW